MDPAFKAENHVNAVLNTTVTRSNLPELPEIFNLAIELGAVSFHPFLLVPTGRGKNLTDEVISAVEYERTLRWIYKQQRSSAMTILEYPKT